MPADPELLAWRFGYGLPLPAGAPGDPATALAAFTGPDAAAARLPAPSEAETRAVVNRAVERRAALRRDRTGGQAAYKQARIELRGFREAGLRLTLARAATSPDGLRERMVRFWAGHFAVRAKLALHGPLSLDLVERAIRPHVAGRFADLLTAVTLHPAMLVYLDQNSSVGPGSRFGRKSGRGLNENLARELMELHTLGSGAPYTQGDVRELAELLTGLAVDREQGFAFRADWAEPGAETVLGTAYNGAGLDPVRAALADLAARPETAAHIARKLAVHFVADDPDNGLVEALAATFRDSGGDLAAVTATLLDHPASWTPDLAKARPPFDLMAATLRALEVPAERIVALPGGPTRRFLMTPLQAMGQPWESPPGPDGWPEEADRWITAQGLASRIAWAMEAPSRLGSLPEPVALARTALGRRADERLLWAVARAETVQEGVALVIASPPFNRR